MRYVTSIIDAATGNILKKDYFNNLNLAKTWLRDEIESDIGIIRYTLDNSVTKFKKGSNGHLVRYSPESDAAVSTRSIIELAQIATMHSH